MRAARATAFQVSTAALADAGSATLFGSAAKGTESASYTQHVGISNIAIYVC